MVHVMPYLANILFHPLKALVRPLKAPIGILSQRLDFIPNADQHI